MNVLVFDIETIPDTLTGRKLYELEGLSDNDVAKAMFAKQVQKTGGSEFLPLHLHKIVAISAVLSSGDSLKVWSLGTADSTEKDLITRFYDGIDRFTPTLVSWNGGGFDLPVLHYRSLLNNVVASRYWDNGEDDREFKFNNYLSRFHWRHVDLMDILAGFNLRAAAPLTQIAVMLGFPGKMGMDGAAVWPAYQQGNIDAIRDYCETDVLNTYLVFLRWQLIRGNLSEDLYQLECTKVRQLLEASDQPHFKEFLDAWDEASRPC
jgi:predicted PolB exonuclease-like 3'-5' exonuclease